MLESRFNKVTGLYSATSLKEMTPTQVFSGEFCEILKNPFFTEHLQATTSVWQKKYFINKIVKNPLRKKRNKWKQLVRKTTTQTKQELNHYLHQVFISFYHSRMSLKNFWVFKENFVFVYFWLEFETNYCHFPNQYLRFFRYAKFHVKLKNTYI